MTLRDFYNGIPFDSYSIKPHNSSLKKLLVRFEVLIGSQPKIGACGELLRMPTYGWIQEDDLEAFYERTERIRDPRPPVAPTPVCPFCLRTFQNRQHLRDHVATAHRVERPALFIGGQEPSPRSIIQRAISADSVEIVNTTSAHVSMDGRPTKVFCTADLIHIISGTKQAEMRLTLSNASERRATPVTTEYMIAFRIASVCELQDVERAFTDYALDSTISLTSIQLFLQDVRSRGPGSEYANGLGEYSLGLLLKERPGTELLTTPFSRYREAFGSALQRLADVERPLARLLSDIIRFAMNDFSTTSTATGFWELDSANALLSNPEREALPPTPTENVVRKPVCLIDHGTGQVLDLLSRMIKQNSMEPNPR